MAGRSRVAYHLLELRSREVPTGDEDRDRLVSDLVANGFGDGERRDARALRYGMSSAAETAALRVDENRDVSVTVRRAFARRVAAAARIARLTDGV